MNIHFFYHSLVSDWNHGNAHFLRGVVTELRALGHTVTVYEAANNWSLKNLRAEHGEDPVRRFHEAYPGLESVRYDPATLDLDEALAEADLVLVHEWNTPALVGRVGEARRQHGFVSLFHDTHHRIVTNREAMRSYDLSGYDGVLAYGRVISRLYLAEGLAKRAWTWHEAADTRRFRPLEPSACDGDVVWVGNWGDGERTEELMEFLLRPVKALGLKARVHGVRYPEEARAALADAGIEYAGWLPNFDVPEVFSRFKLTLHVPRRPYVKALPGIPTIRPFEALACGLPLVCAPWEDTEGLFRAGDYRLARDGRDMTRQLEELLGDESVRRECARNGLESIRSRHTCAHRVGELMTIFHEIASGRPKRRASRRTAALDGRIPV
ncbi:MAG: glycosyltransferase [Verrucomicrobia bacterium]|nr:glycosyltransferase [Verrucomicrobiota bacterium]